MKVCPNELGLGLAQASSQHQLAYHRNIAIIGLSYLKAFLFMFIRLILLLSYYEQLKYIRTS